MSRKAFEIDPSGKVGIPGINEKRDPLPLDREPNPGPLNRNLEDNVNALEDAEEALERVEERCRKLEQQIFEMDRKSAEYRLKAQLLEMEQKEREGLVGEVRVLSNQVENLRKKISQSPEKKTRTKH